MSLSETALCHFTDIIGTHRHSLPELLTYSQLPFGYGEVELKLVCRPESARSAKSTWPNNHGGPIVREKSILACRGKMTSRILLLEKEMLQLSVVMVVVARVSD